MSSKYTSEKVESKPKSSSKSVATSSSQPAEQVSKEKVAEKTSAVTSPVNNQSEENMSKTSKKTSKKSSVTNFIVALVMIVLGIGTGYLIYSQTSSAAPTSAEAPSQAIPDSADQVVIGKVYGAENGGSFTDETDGVLLKGGIEGEGSHRILREGGPARNVYLTSSVLDLNLFNNHQVKVWGETFQGQKAGWLMDVGRVEVVALNAEKPFEEDLEE